MPENESENVPGYRGTTHNDTHRLIPEGVEEREPWRLGGLIDGRRKNVVLTFIDEVHKRAKGIVYTPVYKVIEQADVKAFLINGEDELLDDKMNELAQSQNSTKSIMRQLKKSPTFTEAVASFIE